MKTVALLFSFAFVLVFTAPTDESIQLHTISYEANKILNGGLEFQALLDSLVPAGFNQDRCRADGPEDFCIAETILSAISHTQFGIPLNTLSKIRRVLNQYNKFHPTNCTVKENDDEEQLHDLLTNLCICSQVVNSQLC
uniref:Interleukin n=1 Tax=Hucho hucho TaxID=62062 RepID=A0A4W5RFF1_9TELE